MWPEGVVCMGECTQIFWIRVGGAVGRGLSAGCRLRCRLMFSWWCVWLSVLGGNTFLQCSDATVLFRALCCLAS